MSGRAWSGGSGGLRGGSRFDGGWRSGDRDRGDRHRRDRRYYYGGSYLYTPYYGGLGYYGAYSPYYGYYDPYYTPYYTPYYAPYYGGPYGYLDGATVQPADVEIDVQPDDATVFINGTDYPDGARFSLPPGDWTAEVSAPGYRSQAFELHLRAGHHYTIRRHLRRD